MLEQPTSRIHWIAATEFGKEIQILLLQVSVNFGARQFPKLSLFWLQNHRWITFSRPFILFLAYLPMKKKVLYMCLSSFNHGRCGYQLFVSLSIITQMFCWPKHHRLTTLGKLRMKALAIPNQSGRNSMQRLILDYNYLKSSIPSSQKKSSIP